MNSPSLLYRTNLFNSIFLLIIMNYFIHIFIFPFSLDSNFYPMQTTPRRRSPYDGISLLIILHVFCMLCALHMYEHVSLLNFCNRQIYSKLISVFSSLNPTFLLTLVKDNNCFLLHCNLHGCFRYLNQL